MTESKSTKIITSCDALVAHSDGSRMEDQSGLWPHAPVKGVSTPSVSASVRLALTLEMGLDQFSSFIAGVTLFEIRNSTIGNL